ncbi:MAG TPA: TonB-dependent receptor [Bacteroidetes bacterium]|nr:TonB-dependent receptor [Bacteroidota bacterium]
MKRFYKILLLVIATGGFLSAGAQSQTGVFAGRILDKETGESLVGANIYLKSDMTTGDVSDFNGHFSIALSPGDYQFTVSYTGMKTQTLPVTIKAGSTVFKNILMDPFSIQFKEVEIRAGRFDKKIEDQTVSIEVMKPRLIEAKNTRSVETILNMMPGVTILDQEPQIRGGSGFTFGVGSKVAVFVDDLPIITGDAGKPDWSLIPIEDIKQIEVVKGAASVLSGSSALSGAIYIRTSYPGTKPLTKVQTYTGLYTRPSGPAKQWWKGANYLTGVSFLHTRRLGEGHTDLVVGGVVMADRSYIGAPIPGPWVTQPGDSISDNEMANQKGRVNFKIRRRSKKIKGLNFGLNGNIMFKHQSTALAWLDDTANFYRGYPGAVLLANTVTMYFDPYINLYSSLGVKHQFANRILYNNSDAINNQSNRALMIYNRYQFSKSFKNIGNLDFIGGIVSNYTYAKSNMYEASGSDKNWLWNLSAYMEIEKKFGNALNISIGTRLEHYRLNDSIQDTRPIFRFGSSLKVGQETYLRASIGQGYRFPTITERYIRTSVGSFGVFNNPDLQPEYSWNAEIGLKQGLKFSKFYGYFDIAAFYQEYQNTVEYLFGFWDSTYTFALAGFKFVNTGKSQITGVDISLTGQAKFANFWHINLLLGYTYVKPITLDPDYVFAKDYNPSGAADFSYETTSVNPDKRILKYRFLSTAKMDVEVGYKNFSYGISMRYFSKIVNLDKAIFDFEDATKASGGLLQPILYKNYFYHHNNGNAIFDMRLSYQFREHHKLALISNNVFNRWYSLRPLKAEPMRNVTLQYTLKL